jgi:hypothetical protein
MILCEQGGLNEAVDHYKHALGIFEQLDELKEKEQILPSVRMILSDREDLNGSPDHSKQVLENTERSGDLTLHSQISLDITSIVVHVLLLAFHNMFYIPIRS